MSIEDEIATVSHSIMWLREMWFGLKQEWNDYTHSKDFVKSSFLLLKASLRHYDFFSYIGYAFINIFHLLNLKEKEETDFTNGTTEIWYITKKAFQRNAKKLISKNFPLPKTREQLQKTHQLLTKVKKTDPEQIFIMLQGKFWFNSQNVQHLLALQNVCHTAMMSGDIIIMGNTGYFCDSFTGWKKFTLNK